jgi:protein associated with RNAse G/E
VKIYVSNGSKEVNQENQYVMNEGGIRETDVEPKIALKMYVSNGSKKVNQENQYVMNEGGIKETDVEPKIQHMILKPVQNLEKYITSYRQMRTDEVDQDGRSIQSR